MPWKLKDQTEVQRAVPHEPYECPVCKEWFVTAGEECTVGHGWMPEPLSLPGAEGCCHKGEQAAPKTMPFTRYREGI